LLGLVAVLLLVSAVFSGAETVLFSLSRHDRARMKKSPRPLERLAASLMDDPRSLLTTLLMGNMTCNIINYVVCAILLGHLTVAVVGGSGVEGDGQGVEGGLLARALVAVLAIVPPLLVTYVSDIFPKVIGALNNTRLAPLIALPVATLVRVLWPVSRVIDAGLMRPVHRLVGTRRDQLAFSSDELRELLEMSEQTGVIDVSENQLLQEVVRIAELKVRDVMTPRVDLVAYNVKDPTEKLLGLFRQSHLAKVPVYEGQIDNVLGLVYAKSVLLEPDARKIDVRKLLQAVRFVPEQQTLDRLLVHFRQTRSQIAVVVDEFGGVVGMVALEDVVEQMVGDIYEPHDAAESAMQRVGPDEYLVPGDLSVADWVEAFGARIESTHTSTVAGLIAAMLQRLPREGDEVRLAHLLMRVDSMHGRRVSKVRLKLLADAEGAEAGPGAHRAGGDA
jgi:putative hemolysin